MITSLDHLKAHLNIIEGNDDALLSAKLEASQVAVGNFLGIDLATAYTQFAATVYNPTPDPRYDEHGVDLTTILTAEVISDAPAPIKEAVLQLAAHLFEFRELVLTSDRATPLPYGIFDLVGSYKVWHF